MYIRKKHMNIIPLEKCSENNIFIEFLESVEMPQRKSLPPFSSIGKPKKQDMLLFVRNCKTKYLTVDGRTVNTHDGDVVYVPTGSRYTVECIEDNGDGSTLQINFMLHDDNLSSFVLSEDIQVFSLHVPALRSLFEKSVMLGQSVHTSTPMQQSILLEILATLAGSTNAANSYPIIEKGIDYLSSHYQEDPDITALAAMCNVSCEYFRRLFKKQTGQTPLEYKNSLRMKKAEQYLLYSNLSILDISEQLSSATVSHFIKVFKDTHGCSPLVFRNSSH